MSIDPSNIEQAKEWSKRKLLNPGNDTDGVRVAQVITALPGTIVDGDKLREALDWLDSKPSGDDYDGEFYDRLRALLPAPAPTVEIRLGGRAIHPDHGEVLIASSRPDGDGSVEILFPGLQAGDGTARVWVPADHLSPVPDTHDDSEPAQEPRVLTTVEDYESAACNTVVRRSDDAPATEKVDYGTWWSTEGHIYEDDEAIDFADREARTVEITLPRVKPGDTITLRSGDVDVSVDLFSDGGALLEDMEDSHMVGIRPECSEPLALILLALARRKEQA